MTKPLNFHFKSQADLSSDFLIQHLNGRPTSLESVQGITIVKVLSGLAET